MNKLNTRLIVALVFASLISFNVQAKGNAEAGQQKSTVCQACHGADGNGLDDSYPRLAGQHASYLVKAMQDYRDGKRKNPIMGPMTAALSDEDIEDLAAYYEAMAGLVDLSNR